MNLLKFGLGNAKLRKAWRQSFEPFRGRVWEFGMYLIREESTGTVYVAYHGGQRIFTSADLYEAQLACEGRMA